MRNLLAFVGAALVTFLALGWYLDWYRIQSIPTGPGRHGFHVDFNTHKITEDVQRGVSKGEEKLKGMLRNEAGQAVDSLLQEAEQPPATTQPEPATTSDWPWWRPFQAAQPPTDKK
jgi:hypothetical protein